MARKSAKGSRRPGDEPEGSGLVKKTFRLGDLTAKRLGVEAVMTGESESAIVERVLAAYLCGWRLPSKTGAPTPPPQGEAGRAEDAA